MTVRLSPFITFEGIDGSGKSTALEAVQEHLSAKAPVWVTREETDLMGPAIRRSIQEGADPRVTTHLFVADRAVHVKEIRRHLDAGEWVLCDRYAHSTLAYQGVTLAGPVDDADAWLRSLHTPMGLWPDLVLWFDVDPAIAVERVKGRGATAPYEKVAFLEKVRANYAALAASEPERITRIDASQSPEKVAADAIAAIEPLVRHFA